MLIPLFAPRLAAQFAAFGAPLLAWLVPEANAQEASCANPAANAAFAEGFAAQKAMDSTRALAAYDRCTQADPACVPCWYEVGWTHWSRADWPAVIQTWEKTLTLQPDHAAAKKWLADAKGKAGGARPEDAWVHTPVGTTSKPEGARVQLTLIAKFQNHTAVTTQPGDHYDTDIYSPKSARFLADGSKVYINSLEGLKTVVYDPRKLEKIGVIEHVYTAESAPLFGGQSTVFGYPMYAAKGDPNVFGGKPVESATSHNDRWLWVPYYRRDWDVGARSPAAVSVIDTKTDRITRVFPTGPIPKYVAISPDNKLAAITHWGDNTLGLIDMPSADPATWAYRPERLIVEKALPQENLTGNRDAACGMCLRGTVFTPDSKVLLVARMGDGGIAGFDLASNTFLGTVDGEKPTPRHLVLSPDGQWVYLSSNKSGVVARIELDKLLTSLRSAKGGHVVMSGWQEVDVGSGARTIELSPDGKLVFVALNSNAELVAIDTATMSVVSRVRTDAYTVGLAVSPDGRQVWTTSQGNSGKGGNSVCVYEVTTK